MLSHVAAELLARALLLALVLSLVRAAVVLERELAVDGHHPVLDEHDRVDDDAVSERMLCRKGPRRQRLLERLFEEHLAERAAQLRRLEQVLEARDLARQLLDPLRGLVQPSELLADFLEQAARAPEMFGDRLLPGVEALLDASDPGLHPAAQLLEPPVDGLRGLAGARRLGEDLVEPRPRLLRPRQEQRRRSDPQHEDRERQTDEDGSGGHRLQDSPGKDK